MKALLAVLLFILLSPKTAEAQQFQASLSHYSMDDGLASNVVSKILQDDYGFIWISTWNGLSRFDGYNFYNYKTGAASGIPKLHNRILDMVIDTQQNVWLRMYDGRVFVLKRSTDTIINAFENVMTNEEPFTNYPLMVTSSGDVLVNVDGVGLYKLRMEQNGIQSQLITAGNLTVTSMAEGYQNDIWLGTDNGVHRMDMSNLTIERKGVFLDENVTVLFSNGYNIYVGTESGKICSFSYGQDSQVLADCKNRISALFVDSHGIIWYSDNRDGVHRIMPDTHEEKTFVQRVTVPDYDGKGGEFGEVNGTVWARMNRGGYGYYNREKDEIEYFHNDPSNPWNLSNTINARLELSEGVVWESTSRRGLEKLEIQKKTIERVLLSQTQAMSNDIRAIAFDTRRQQLLIANKAGELYIKRANGETIIVNKDSKGEALGRIYGIYIDSKGNYWLSSKGKGLFKFTPNATADHFSIECYRHDKNTYSLGNDNVYNCVEDSQGNIWVATYGGGVNIMTRGKDGKVRFIHSGNVMHRYPFNSHMKVRCLAKDQHDNVWVGTTDGILIMTYKNGKLSIENVQPSEEDHSHILNSNDIVCLALDPQGDMWVGTNGGGIARAIGKDSKGHRLFENYGAAEGLPNEEIKGITFDDRGNVWFSTDHILCSFDTSKRIVTTFSSLEGVDDTGCSEGSAVCLPNGNVLFGTVNGYYVVDRAKLVTSTGNVLKLRITDFWLDNILQSPRLTDVYDYYVPESRKVVLPNHDSEFTFRFASLNFQLQHRVHYQYMLDGYDKEWRNADRTRMATYSDLPTGSYHFKVKAFLLESPEKFDMRDIEVEVPPYFILSSGAIWLYMALFLTLGIWFLLWNQNKLAKSEKLRMLREGPRSHKNIKENDDFLIFLNDYLALHFSDPMLSVEDMVEAADMQEDKFLSQLRRSSGMSPKEYVSEYRVRQAMNMLESTSDDISKIAYNCGYIDVASFNRNFKLLTGFMPSRYRDMHKV